MTAESSILAITLASPPHFSQVDTSMSPKAPTFGEDPLEALGPGHGPMALFGCFLPCTTLATFGRCYINPIFSIWSKHAMEAGQVYPRFGYQGCQLGNEIQRIEDDVRGPIVVGRLELVADIA